MTHSAVPIFFLYGEPRRAAGPRFLHLESLAHRSRPSQWTIRPHAHTDLHHVFSIAAGAGRLTAEAHVVPFEAPCLLVVPAGVVHGFAFDAETEGSVLTLAEPYLRELIRREPAFAAIFTGARYIPATGAPDLEDGLSRLSRELVWNAPGHGAAVEGHLLGVLVQTLRLAHHAASGSHPVYGRAAQLVARFRETIEQRFRKPLSLADYARALSVTEAQLRRACRQVADCPPMRLVHDRILLEAERIMLYTNMTVAEAAEHLGFDDAAYFSRFVAKRAGRSPRAVRLGGATE